MRRLVRETDQGGWGDMDNMHIHSTMNPGVEVMGERGRISYFTWERACM